jgi:hypothetical protein
MHASRAMLAVLAVSKESHPDRPDRRDVAAKKKDRDRDRERQKSREREKARGGGARILQHWASSSSSLSQKRREGWVAVGSFIWVRLEEHCQAVRLVGSPNPPSVARGPSR